MSFLPILLFVTLGWSLSTSWISSEILVCPELGFIVSSFETPVCCPAYFQDPAWADPFPIIGICDLPVFRSYVDVLCASRILHESCLSLRILLNTNFRSYVLTTSLL
jgi:hypothetical protein